MIIDENGPTELPDDAQRGGTMEFDFTTVSVDFPRLCLLDMDNSKNDVLIYHGEGSVEEIVSLKRECTYAHMQINL